MNLSSVVVGGMINVPDSFSFSALSDAFDADLDALHALIHLVGAATELNGSENGDWKWVSDIRAFEMGR